MLLTWKLEKIVVSPEECVTVHNSSCSAQTSQTDDYYQNEIDRYLTNDIINKTYIIYTKNCYPTANITKRILITSKNNIFYII